MVGWTMPMSSGSMRLVRLAELSNLNIRRPESIQRSLDEERIAEIVEYQTARINAGKDPLFPGVIVVATASDADPRWIIDGQHRWMSMLQLADLVPEYIVAIHELRLEHGVGLAELFRLINSSIPVPAHLVDEMLTDATSALLKDFEATFKKRYKPFLTRTAMPRRPNVNLDHIKDAIYANRGTLLAQLTTADALMEFVVWVNAQLLEKYVHPEFRDRAMQKSITDPLVISYDVDMKWTSDPCWVNAFLAKQPSPPLDMVYRSNQKRKAIPQAMRIALWKTYHGERAGVGHCYVCSAEITHFNFDVGHVVSVAEGGSDEKDNLRPICRQCNLSMGTTNLYEFKKRLYPES